MTATGRAHPPLLSGFEYREWLGSGGYSDVFLYEQQMPRMPVAVKVLLDDAVTDGVRRRFVDEANTMAQLSAHPHIVQILAAGVAVDQRPYLVMQYYPGLNLSERARSEPLTVADTLRIGIQITSAVETAHRAGILHRDIKPANILTGRYGEPGLTDFGIAVTKTADPVGEAQGMSVPWSPPEAFDPVQALDERSDVYSLAASLHTLLTGRSPFEVAGGANEPLDLAGRIEHLSAPSTGRGDVPPSLERLLAQAMAKDPAARPQSALEFARALQAIEQELRLKVTALVVPQDSVAPPRQRLADDGGHTVLRPARRVIGQGPVEVLVTESRMGLDDGPPDGPTPAMAMQERRTDLPEPSPVEDTRLREVPVAPEPSAAEAVPARRSILRAQMIVAVAVAVGVAAVIVMVGLALRTTRGSDGASSPIHTSSRSLQAPSNVAMWHLDDEWVQVAWDDRDQRPGDSYVVETSDGSTFNTSDTSLKLFKRAQWLCVQVRLVRSGTQQMSSAGSNC